VTWVAGRGERETLVLTIDRTDSARLHSHSFNNTFKKCTRSTKLRIVCWNSAG